MEQMFLYEKFFTGLIKEKYSQNIRVIQLLYRKLNRRACSDTKRGGDSGRKNISGSPVSLKKGN